MVTHFFGLGSGRPPLFPVDVPLLLPHPGLLICKLPPEPLVVDPVLFPRFLFLLLPPLGRGFFGHTVLVFCVAVFLHLGRRTSGHSGDIPANINKRPSATTMTGHWSS